MTTRMPSSPAPLSFSSFIEAVLGPAQLAQLDEAMRWGSLSDAQRVRFFADERQAAPAQLLGQAAAVLPVEA